MEIKLLKNYTVDFASAPVTQVWPVLNSHVEVHLALAFTTYFS